MRFYLGAWSHQPAQSASNVLGSIERRGELLLLAALVGDLASIALELLKNQFAQRSISSTAELESLIGGIPPMLATSISAVLIDGNRGDRIYAAATGGGHAYRQRGARLEPLRADTRLAVLDYVIASTATLNAEFQLAAFKADGGADPQRNDTLDDVLQRALRPLPQATALAVALVGD